MKTPSLAFLFLILLALAGCNDPYAPDCLKSTGNTSEESRSVGFFHRILVKDNIDIRLVEGSPGMLKVRGGRNLFPKIKTDLRGTELIIENQNTCNWVRDYHSRIEVEIGIASSTLTIDHDGYGDVIGDLLAVDSLLIDAEGASDYRLHFEGQYLFINSESHGDFSVGGTTDSLNIALKRFSSLHAFGLVAQEGRVLHQGEKDLEVHVQSSMKVIINSVGNVYYKGEPELIVERVASGEVIEMD